MAMLSSVPGVSMYSPDTYEDLENTLEKAVRENAFTVIRYPRGKEIPFDRSRLHRRETLSFADVKAPAAVIVTYGRLTANALRAADMLAETHAVRVVRLDRIYPLDANDLLPLLTDAPLVLFAEEGIRSGGIGEKLGSLLSENGYGGRYAVRSVENRFVPGGDLPSLDALLGFTPEALAAFILENTEK